MFGIGNTFATIPGVIAPYLVGLLTPNQTSGDWRIVFIITAVVYALGGIVLLLFTQGEPEPWATHEKANTEDEEERIPMSTKSN